MSEYMDQATPDEIAEARARLAGYGDPNLEILSDEELLDELDREYGGAERFLREVRIS